MKTESILDPKIAMVYHRVHVQNALMSSISGMRAYRYWNHLQARHNKKKANNPN